jgi:TRAP-type C4-dicarboxylate transport system permease small subunit
MVYNVFSRYALGKGITWYMESAQFLNVWAMFLGGIALCATNDHLRVTMAEEAARGKGKSLLRILVSLLTIVFYCFLAYSSYLLSIRSRQTISTMEPLKMSYVYWLLPLAGGLSALAAMLDLAIFLLPKPQTRGEAADDRIHAD